MVACKDCGKEFESRMSMEQHYAAKHAKPKPVPVQPKKSGKKLILVAAVVLLVAVAAYFAFAGNSGEKPVVSSDDAGGINLDEVPKRPIHWHPQLTILINGEQQRIPHNLGISGSIHYPVHTHDDLPVLHYENSRPTPETMTLGYFINTVWRRTFSSSCIFEYCNGEGGNLTMTVNGAPNYQFHNYIPKDGDEIVVRFE